MLQDQFLRLVAHLQHNMKAQFTYCFQIDCSLALRLENSHRNNTAWIITPRWKPQQALTKSQSKSQLPSLICLPRVYPINPQE